MLFFKKKNDHNALISPLLVSVVFGLSAGAVGTLLVIASAPNPGPLYQQGTLQTVVHVPSGSAGSPDASAGGSVRSSALVFAAKKAGITLADGSFIASDAVGSALVLTSDGWLVSDDAVFTAAVRAALPAYRIVIGSAAYAIDAAVTDPFTGVVFVKVDAANLPVTSYLNGTDLQAGDHVYLFDAFSGLRVADVVGYGSRPVSAPSGLIRSSERQQMILRLSGTGGAVPPGSMVVGASGEAVAVFVGDDVSGSTAIPFGTFSTQIGSILHDRKAHRPYLGVRSIDLSRTLGIAAFGARPRGALLAASADGTPAVQRRSPADDAGLKEGDLILAVNDQELGAETALADVLADYEPGNVVTLMVRRGGTTAADVPIKVTLSEVP
jgi:hypothetical protein